MRRSRKSAVLAVLGVVSAILLLIPPQQSSPPRSGRPPGTARATESIAKDEPAVVPRPDPRSASISLGEGRANSRREEQRAYVAERARAVARQLTKVEAWYRARPMRAGFEPEMARRRSEVSRWARKLGLQVLSADCREGACRVELAPDPEAEHRTRLRPVPRVEEMNRHAALFRLPGDHGLHTVLFKATDGAALPDISEGS